MECSLVQTCLRLKACRLSRPAARCRDNSSPCCLIRPVKSITCPTLQTFQASRATRPLLTLVVDLFGNISFVSLSNSWLVVGDAVLVQFGSSAVLPLIAASYKYRTGSDTRLCGNAVCGCAARCAEGLCPSG